MDLSELKIDRSFIADMANNSHHLTIVESTIQMSKALKLRVVAEGVEDMATAELLTTIGCDMIQGYGICRPVPLDVLVIWINDSPYSIPKQLTKNTMKAVVTPMIA